MHSALPLSSFDVGDAPRARVGFYVGADRRGGAILASVASASRILFKPKSGRAGGRAGERPGRALLTIISNDDRRRRTFLQRQPEHYPRGGGGSAGSVKLAPSVAMESGVSPEEHEAARAGQF